MNSEHLQQVKSTRSNNNKILHFLEAILISKFEILIGTELTFNTNFTIESVKVNKDQVDIPFVKLHQETFIVF